MKKILIAIIVLVLIIVALAISGLVPVERVVQQTDQFESVDLAKIDTNNLISVVSTVILPKPQLTLPSLESGLADRAWQVFQNYLTSAKAHDLEGLRKVSYQISSVCNDPTQEKACFARMDGAYDLGIQFKRKEMTNLWSDNKQIIMASAYTTVDDTSFGSRGMARAIIYFTRDEAGNPKVLSFNGLDGSFVLKKDLSDEELDQHLLESIQDDDEDGLPNKVETCADKNSSLSLCTETDPNKRDTNEDGWWDGIEILFY